MTDKIKHLFDEIKKLIMEEILGKIEMINYPPQPLPHLQLVPQPHFPEQQDIFF